MNQQPGTRVIAGKFTKKPVTVEAIQFNGNSNKQDVERFVGKELKAELESETAYVAGKGAPIFSLLIETKEGVMKAFQNDWIIKEPFPTGDRDFYPCKPNIFELTFLPLTDGQLKPGMKVVARRFEDGHWLGYCEVRKSYTDKEGIIKSFFKDTAVVDFGDAGVYWPTSALTPVEKVEKYSYHENHEDTMGFTIIHTENDIETYIAITDSAEKADLITKALNQFKY